MVVLNAVGCDWRAMVGQQVKTSMARERESEGEVYGQ